MKKAEAFRLQLIEIIAETDDVLLEKFLEGETPTIEELKAGIRQATIDLKVFPVICGTAFKNKGVQTLLDAVVDYLPSPLDKPPVEGIDPHDHEKIVYAQADDNEPLSALAFKIINDPFGKLCFIRVYSGSSEDRRHHPESAHRQDRPRGRLVKMHANKREDITEILCRRYLRLRGPEGTEDRRHALRAASSHRARRDHFPGDGDLGGHRAQDQGRPGKDGHCAGRLADEDPTFKVRTDEDSGQTIISGMGELHLEILVDRMKREHKVEANVGEPKVAFRETIRKVAEAEGKYIRQTGGSGNYGHLLAAYRAERAGQGLRVPERSQGRRGTQGIHQADRSGRAGRDASWASWPATRSLTSRFTSTTAAITMWTRTKWRSSLPVRSHSRKPRRKASPVLLEPVMAVEVTVPEEHMGTIIGDINSRRGRIEGMEHAAGSQVIKAIVPLKEMFGYVNDIRSSTQGRASYGCSSRATKRRRA